MAEIKYAGATTLSEYDKKIKAVIAGKSDSGHSHAWSAITSKPSYYDAKAIKSITRSGTTFTWTCMDGTTGTFTQQDNNTTYTLSSFGITATAAELNYCDGVTSNIQTQLNGKAATHSHPYLSNSYRVTEIGFDNTNLLYATIDGTKYQIAYGGNWYSSNASRTANTVLAAPNGSNGIASFRKLVAADLPSHTHNYAGSASVGGFAHGADVLSGVNSRMEYGWSGLNYYQSSGNAGATAGVNDTPTTAWWHILRFNHANSAGFYTDLAVPFNDTSLYYKRITGGVVQNGGWVKVLDSLNYTSYCAPASHTHSQYYQYGSEMVCSGIHIGGQNGAYIYSADGGYNMNFRWKNGANGGYGYGSLVELWNGMQNAYSSTVSRTANTVLAAPNGSAGSAGFRKLVGADMPDTFTKHMYLTVNSVAIGASGGAMIFFGTNAVKPINDNSYANGTSECRYTNIYAVNGTIKTSDENEKDILDSGITSDYENWYLNLKPILYKWKNFDWQEHKSDRVHCGFGARKSLETAKKYGLDEMTIAAICRDDLDEELPDGRTERYGFRYEELIPMNTHMIQKTVKQLEEKDVQIAELQNKLDKLLTHLGISDI